MKKILALLISINSFFFAQVEYSGNINQAGNPPLFFYDAAQVKSTSAGRTRLEIYVQVPYSSLSFTKKDAGFNASYNVTLSLMDEKKENIITEKTWKEKISTADFNQTLSNKNFSLSYKYWDLLPGSYILKTILEDGDSRRTSAREMPVKIREFSDSLDVSDILLVYDIIKDSTGEKLILNVSRTVTNKDRTLKFYYNIFSNSPKEVFVEYYLNDQRKGTSTKQLDPRKLLPGKNSVSFEMSKTDFSIGNYTLKIVLKDKDWREIKTVEKNFIAKIYGVPNSILDLDKAIEQITYIASPAEKDFIEDAKTFEEKMNRFLAFWEKKKPNPRAEENPIMYEYYRRIEYANKHFKGFGEGWKSDMGMIYVTFGPPSSVERHPLDPNSKPYEIWQYHEINRSFIFVDETGFGNYRLLNADYSRWPGYRP
ncbi:MAG: GWxTD domain-containing protein [Bacteroidota bacterium]